MTTHNIKLPPLPWPAMNEGDTALYAAFAGSQLTDYARAAIEAYQQRLQDPHAVTLAMCHRTIAPITFDMLAYVLGDAERYAWVIDQRRYIMGEPVGKIFTMEPLVPGGEIRTHATIYKKLPAGTDLYTAPQLAAPEPPCET